MYTLSLDDKRYIKALENALQKLLNVPVQSSVSNEWVIFRLNYLNVNKKDIEDLLNQLRSAKMAYTIYLEDDFVKFTLKIQDLIYFASKLTVNGYIRELENYLDE